MTDRRSIYFAYQGLLMSVLLLIFIYQYKGVEGWLERFYLLIAALGCSLLGLRLVSLGTLSKWWFQAGLFVGDSFLASLTLYWTNAKSDLYLIYMLIIYGTALTREFSQSFVVTIVTSVLYLASAWSPLGGLPHDTGFWLRFLFLWTSSVLLAILSRDAKQAQADQEQKYQERLVKIESLATLGQVAGEVAHRIKGPLTTIMVNAEILSHRHGRSKEIVKELSEIQQEVTNCKEILKNLLDLGRIEEMDFALLDLRGPVRLALKSIETQMRRFDIRKEVAGLDSPLMVIGDPSMLQEALSAVLHNAVDATRWKGAVRLSVREAGSRFSWPKLLQAPPAYCVVIEDDGKGIEPKDLERIFQPFFTTKGQEGSGLGLSAALRILQKHDGTIEAYSDGPGQGARFTLIIPKALPQLQPRAQPRESARKR